MRHLLTHTSGLPPTWEGWRRPLGAAADASAPRGRSDRRALVADLLATPLEVPPGTRFCYSCAGYNTVMAYLEAATGESWDGLLDRWTIVPLGLAGVTPRPSASRCAATEHDPVLRRGVVQGVVHDEAAWGLGGNAGNAGLFASGRALLAFAERLRIGEGHVLGELMWDDALSRVLGRTTTEPRGGFGAALGPRIGDPAFSGPVPDLRGHTGFTGTSIAVSRRTGTSLVLLTNSVHPERTGPGIRTVRAAVAEAVFARRAA